MTSQRLSSHRVELTLKQISGRLYGDLTPVALLHCWRCIPQRLRPVEQDPPMLRTRARSSALSQRPSMLVLVQNRMEDLTPSTSHLGWCNRVRVGESLLMFELWARLGSRRFRPGCPGQ